MFNLFDQNLMVQAMRDELTRAGFVELTTPEAVDEALAESDGGTTLLMFNSVCGCAAGSARPGVVLSLQHESTPQRLLTVFAGQDRDATEQARHYLPGQPATSPSVFLLRDGQVVFALHRLDIEGHEADAIAQRLMTAYDQHCTH